MEKVEPMYYLQCLERSHKKHAFWLTFVSVDAALFNSLYLKKAKKFTRAEALEICTHSKYMAFPCSIVESLIELGFDTVQNKQLHKPIFNENQNKF